MEKVGVELLVEGLSQFKGDLSQAGNALKGLNPLGDLLSSMFSSLGNVISNFVSGALRVLEYTLGQLIADAIEAVIQGLKELISQTIAAGSEFQTLSIRLNGLNLPASASDIKDWSAAMAEASDQTQQQLEWIQLLSSATPFDATDIANAYTLARTYGFDNEEAQKLTKSIVEFTAGMGLSSDAVERVIQNLGQMIQRGKITSTEMRDLARGAFLPLEDVLDRVAKNMGVTKEALTELISTKEGVPAEEFVKAFEQMVAEEPRFVGAAGRLGRTFEAAKNNALDMVRSIGGLNIVKPVLDVLGESVASLVDEFVNFNDQGDLIKTEKWDRLVSAATGFGKALSDILTKILDLLPSSASFTEGIITGLENITDWLNDHSDDIVNWVRDAAKWIGTTLIPKLIELKDWLFGVSSATGEGQKGALQTLAESAMSAAHWIGEVLIPFVTNSLMPLLASLLPLAGAVAAVITTMFGGTPDTSLSDFIHDTLIPNIQKLTNFINKNKDAIAFWAKVLLIAFGVLAVGAAFISLIISAFFALLSAVAFVVAGVIGAITALGVIIFNWVAKTIASFISWRLKVAEQFRQWASDIKASVLQAAANFVSSLSGKILAFNWFSVGASIISAIISGFTSMVLPAITIPTTTGGGTGGTGTGTDGTGVGGTCFIAGTLVTMADGSFKPIEKVEVGDLVLSYDPDKGFYPSAKVTEVFRHKAEETEKYLLINGLIGVTPDHLVYADMAWKRAGDLKIGDQLLDQTGHSVPVREILTYHENVPTYNLHTDNRVHNYFANGLLVHNGKNLKVAAGGMNTAPSVAAGSVVTSSQVVNNYFNLNIQSSANTEPIIQDFGMMQSMAGRA